jgi:hypothetical protein
MRAVFLISTPVHIKFEHQNKCSLPNLDGLTKPKRDIRVAASVARTPTPSTHQPKLHLKSPQRVDAQRSACRVAKEKPPPMTRRPPHSMPTHSLPPPGPAAHQAKPQRAGIHDDPAVESARTPPERERIPAPTSHACRGPDTRPDIRDIGPHYDLPIDM